MVVSSVVCLLWRGGDGEGMPLELGDAGDVEVHVVARLEGEVGRALDHKTNHLHTPTISIRIGMLEWMSNSTEFRISHELELPSKGGQRRW